MCQETLNNGTSVVIDNTNAQRKTRALYISQAKKLHIPVRCFHFTTSEEVAKHLNMFREVTLSLSLFLSLLVSLQAHSYLSLLQKQSGRKHVPRIGYVMFKKNFEEPNKNEGYTEIRKIDFQPLFESKEDERMFLEFT